MTHNRPGPLRRCLESLASQTLPSTAFDVVLVDGSREPVRDIVAEFSTRLAIVHDVGPNLGVAGNRNRGASLAGGTFLAFLDDDCVAMPDWLESLGNAVGSSPDAMVGGGVAPALPTNAYGIAGQAITEAVDAFYNPPGKEPRFLPGLNLAMRTADYRSIGGCDPRFGRLAAEDRDLVDRWRQSGRRLARCPDAVVRHEHRTSFAGFVRQYFNYGRGAWRYHCLRRARGSGVMSEDARLHLELPRHFRRPLAGLGPWMMAKVLALLVVWQLANLAGFIWQAWVEMAGMPRSRETLPT